jgi:hypothetical protein
MGAFGVAFYTLRHQEKKDKPVVISRKYLLALKIKSILSNSTTQMVQLKYSDNKHLTYFFVESFKFKNQVEEFLPECLVVSKEMHDFFDHKINELLMLINGYSKLIQNTTIHDPSLIDQYFNDFQDWCVECADYCWEIYREIVGVQVQEVNSRN